ncbi:MAG TPA: protein-L-isoaspartate O-methyltransferase [Pseudolabrys sp.]|nr:protein-L-isoaspartate O-methyltransferase [Pseudolabrys sp.]
MTDFAAARRNMVDGQVRTADVTDLRIISAMLEIPRERFVPPASVGLAYLDLDLPVGKNGSRRLLKPMVLARLIHAADIMPGDRVLDIGCATGYGAAVLAHVAGQVVALEQNADLAQAARTALSEQPNVSVVSGPLTAGWPQGSPYDAVVLEGGTEIPPESFLSQLKEGGRLVCVLGGGPGSKAMRYCRSGDELGGRPIFDATAAVLPGFAKTPVFAF